MLAQLCNVYAVFGRWSVYASDVLKDVNTARQRAYLYLSSAACQSLWLFLYAQDGREKRCGSAARSGEPLQPVSSSNVYLFSSMLASRAKLIVNVSQLDFPFTVEGK